MDRVLLVIDDIQYCRHVEMTLRKVGFDVESINNEFNFSERMLSFNPDYVVVRGTSARLSTINVGRKLFDAGAKFTGKSMLIFPKGTKMSPEDLSKLKIDLLLFEPVSTLRLAMHVLKFSSEDFEFIKEKLLKFAITDNQFRNYEQQVLKGAGVTIDSEIQIVSGMTNEPPAVNEKPATVHQQKVEKPALTRPTAKSKIETSEINARNDGKTNRLNLAPNPEVSDEPIFPEPDNISEEAKQKFSEELQSAELELPLRIDTYNHSLKKVELDTNIGLKKRQTKKAVKELRKDLINEQKTDIETEQKLDDERVRFAQALFKKNK